MAKELIYHTSEFDDSECDLWNLERNQKGSWAHPSNWSLPDFEGVILRGVTRNSWKGRGSLAEESWDETETPDDIAKLLDHIIQRRTNNGNEQYSVEWDKDTRQLYFNCSHHDGEDTYILNLCYTENEREADYQKIIELSRKHDWPVEIFTHDYASQLLEEEFVNQQVGHLHKVDKATVEMFIGYANRQWMKDRFDIGNGESAVDVAYDFVQNLDLLKAEQSENNAQTEVDKMRREQQLIDHMNRTKERLERGIGR